MDTAMANEFPPLLDLPGGRAPSVARKSPTAARITARFWRQPDDGDADSECGSECRLLEDRRDANKAFESLSARGLPAVRGEIVEGGVAGYHYYPGREQAVGWFAQEGLATVDESFKRDNGWGYRHFLLRDDGRCHG